MFIIMIKQEIYYNEFFYNLVFFHNWNLEAARFFLLICGKIPSLKLY